MLYPTYAIGVAQDPADPENTVGALWRGGRAASGPAIPAFDIEESLFTTGDVDWDAVAASSPRPRRCSAIPATRSPT